MCGRYTLYTGEEAEEIRQIIDIAQRQVNGQLKLGEVFPSDRATILVANQDKVVVRTATRGFPGFQGKGLLINARSETAEEKYLFQYEDSTVVYLAGLWEMFEGKRRYTILTTQPNQAIAAVHNRMPVLLAKEQVRPWLIVTTAALGMLNGSQPELVGKLLK